MSTSRITLGYKVRWKLDIQNNNFATVEYGFETLLLTLRG